MSETHLTSVTPRSVLRELDCRFAGGLHVRLLWCQADGRIWVTVADKRTGETFRIDVRDQERPRDVFDHPYAYAAHHRIEPRPRNRDADPQDRGRAAGSRSVFRLR